MSRKKISTTIYVTPEQNDSLKLLHERTKVPVAVFIREGIDLVLAHYAHLLRGHEGSTPTGSGTGLGSDLPPAPLPGMAMPRMGAGVVGVFPAAPPETNVLAPESGPPDQNPSHPSLKR
jgi:hypothetical protein